MTQHILVTNDDGGPNPYHAPQILFSDQPLELKTQA